MNMLDNYSALINFKNRNGFNVATPSVVSVYSAQQKMIKVLKIKLDGFFSYPGEKDEFIDKIVDRCDDIEKIECVNELISTSTATELIQLASGKKWVRTFFKIARNFTA